MQSVAFDAPGGDGSCVAYVRLTPPPLSWLKGEAGAAEVRARPAAPYSCGARRVRGAWGMAGALQLGYLMSLVAFASSTPTWALHFPNTLPMQVHQPRAPLLWACRNLLQLCVHGGCVASSGCTAHDECSQLGYLQDTKDVTLRLMSGTLGNSACRHAQEEEGAARQRTGRQPGRPGRIFRVEPFVQGLGPGSKGLCGGGSVATCCLLYSI